jgi:hypothetical protein
MTAFKDTEVGKFLATKGVAALGIVGDVLPSAGVLGIVKNVISGATELSAGDKATAAAKLEQEMSLYTLDAQTISQAQKTQAAADSQEDLFTKRFVPILTIVLFVVSILLIVGLYFVSIPKENQSLVYMALGIILGGFSSSISFWFGTSFSSAKKTEQLYTQMNKA